MTMPIFNENWEHLPLNPVLLHQHHSKQLHTHSTTMTSPLKGNLVHLSKFSQHLGTNLRVFEAIFVNYTKNTTYLTAFGNIWEQI